MATSEILDTRHAGLLTRFPAEGEAKARLTGISMMFGRDCWYPPAVKPTDLLKVDFDVLGFQADGLYLVEDVSGSRIEWRGCRRFRMEPATGALELDATGTGSWVDAATATNWRIAGRVLEVYRATT